MFGQMKGASAPAAAPAMLPGSMPGAAPGAMPMAAPQPATGGGLFGGMSQQARYDMAMQALQNGMQQASGTSNPLLAFLSPMAGAVIGGNIQGKMDQLAGQRQAEMNEKLLGPMAGDQRAMDLVSILSGEGVPKYAQQLAGAQLGQMLRQNGLLPAKGKGGGGRRRGGGKRRSGKKDDDILGILEDDIRLDPLGVRSEAVGASDDDEDDY
jgi:hypothetical protein